MASVKDLETELEQARADIAALASLAAERGSDRAHGLSDAMQAMLGELSDEGRAAFEKARSEGTKLRSRAEEEGAHAPARGRRARRGRRRRSGIRSCGADMDVLSGILAAVRCDGGETGKRLLTRKLAGGASVAICLLIAAVLTAHRRLSGPRPGPRPAPGPRSFSARASRRLQWLPEKWPSMRRARTAPQRRRAEPDPLALAAAGFVLGLLSGPGRGERSD